MSKPTDQAELIAKHVRKISRFADVTRGEQSVLLAAAELIDRLSAALSQSERELGTTAVTTVAELEALPRLSVVQTPGQIWQKLGGSPAYYEWQAADGGFARNSENFLDCNQHLTILMQTKGTL